MECRMKTPSVGQEMILARNAMDERARVCVVNYDLLLPLSKHSHNAVAS